MENILYIMTECNFLWIFFLIFRKAGFKFNLSRIHTLKNNRKLKIFRCIFVIAVSAIMPVQNTVSQNVHFSPTFLPHQSFIISLWCPTAEVGDAVHSKFNVSVEACKVEKSVRVQTETLREIIFKLIKLLPEV